MEPIKVDESKYFILNISPMTSPRPRATSRGWIYMPTWYQVYIEHLIKGIKELNIALLDYSKLEVIAYFPYPKSTAKKRLIDNYPCRVKPDVDNVYKAISDALEKAEIINNDSQIYKAIITKLYTTNKEGRILFKLI